MDIREIKKLIKLMIDNDLSELDLRDGDNKILLKRGSGAAGAAAASPSVVAGPAETAAEPAGENLIEIKSPMVGTFYAAQSPDSEPFISLGAAVAEDTVVCIVEAMKVMNEIKAECSGAVAEICVGNAQPVEYGQVLFRVRRP